MEEAYNKKLIQLRISQLKNIRLNNISECASKCRIKNDELFKELLSTVDNIKNYNLNEMEEDKRVAFLAKYISDIQLYQPFFDGNTRTTVILLGTILKYYGIEFNYDFYNDNKVNFSIILARTFFDAEDRYKETEEIIRSNCSSQCLPSCYYLRNK